MNKHDDVAILDQRPRGRARRSHWRPWLLAGGVLVLAWAALSGQRSAVLRADPAQAAKGPAASELASKFQGSYPTAVAEHGERRYELRAAPAAVQIVPGVRTSVWAYNGQVPGPVLHAHVGERVRVAFKNDLPQPTTIHWHGIRVPNVMDGVPDVTQAPIPPGGSFEYSFVARDPGTFWYHPHLNGSEQLERGLQGVVVVDDDKPPPWSRDVVWVLDDWRTRKPG
jgi:FtsP/CotA-like multicopper oxidase with cupredoxin domain